jgi:uncharacterized Zn finger protein
LAIQAGAWDALRDELIEIASTSASISDLIRIFLAEHELDAAVDLLPAQRRKARWQPWGDNVELLVAEAAELDRPEIAREIYATQAQRLIEARGRYNYQAAAECLAKVRDLDERSGEVPSWSNYIAQLKQEHRGLPALMSELKNAGL